MHRAEWLRKWVRTAGCGTLLVCLGALSGCKTHDDAVAASQQMAETAQTMQRYYATLSALIVSNEDVQRAQGYVNGTGLDAQTLGELEDARLEMSKRERLAGEIARLSALFAEITSSSAADDAAKAAGALNDELVSLKVGATSNVATSALKIAVTSLVNALRAHDEVKAAKLLDPVLVALCSFYDAEKPLYVSLSDSYYKTASANAKALIGQNQVATGTRYRSSLEPFGLEPDVHAPALLKAAQDDMNREVDEKLAERIGEDAAAADNLSEALHRMQARIDTVAKGGALRVRTPPLTLAGVKAWITDVQTQTGVSL